MSGRVTKYMNYTSISIRVGPIGHSGRGYFLKNSFSPSITLPNVGITPHCVVFAQITLLYQKKQNYERANFKDVHNTRRVRLRAE